MKISKLCVYKLSYLSNSKHQKWNSRYSWYYKRERKPTWISPDAQLVLRLLACDWKHVVFGVSCFSFSVLHVHSKPISLTICDSVNLVQSKPKLPIQVTKAILIVSPVAVEINRAILSLLEHSPSTTGCCLVTVHFKGTCTIRVNCIDTADFLSRFKNLYTASGVSYDTRRFSWLNMRICLKSLIYWKEKTEKNKNMNPDYITLTWDLKPTKISKSGGDGDGGGSLPRLFRSVSQIKNKTCYCWQRELFPLPSQKLQSSCLQSLARFEDLVAVNRKP